jgi:diguanylate cyclase (GGDEF)-like protein
MTTRWKPTGRSPLQLLLIVALSIFIAETVVMLFLPFVHEFAAWVEALLDAALLVVSVFPALYFFAFRPMARRIAEREQAEAALQKAHGELEQRVQQRTAELEQANDQLRGTVGQLAQRTEELGLLAEMAETLQACLTAEEAYAAVARSAQRLFPAVRGALFVYSPSRNDLETQAAWGGLALTTQERVFTPEDCWALRRGRMHHMSDTRTDAPCHHLITPPAHGYLCVPLMAQGDALGVLHLQPRDVPAAAGNEQLIEAAADQIGLALANVRLRETLRNQSIRDPLTGLYNRRYMEETLEREMRRAERSARPLSLIMLDIDYFKRFNDTHGHEAGDVLLRDLGAFLRSHIRGGDIACRYGGEEFTLVLPETSLADACARAEHLREGIHGLTVQHHGQTLETVTASLGAAAWQPSLTAQQVLRAADQALYRAKAEGRDRVLSAE